MNKDYDTIEAAILFLETHFEEQPSLDAVAQAVGLSPFQLQKLFKRWAGISPKRFLQFLTLQHSRSLLDEEVDLLDASLQSGLSGPGRLHDLYVQLEGVSPGEYKRLGDSIRIQYGFHNTPFGLCLMATSTRGICGLSFLAENEKEDALLHLRRIWSLSEFVHNPTSTAAIVNKVFGTWNSHEKLELFVKGTNLQVKVWEALLRVPEGQVCAYENIAHCIGNPKATRAVASALRANLIGYLIPCHRVLRKNGHIGGYRWGVPRKRAMLLREMSEAPALRLHS